MKEPQGKDKKEILKWIKREKEQEMLKTKGKVIEQEGIEQKKLQRNSRKKRIKEKLEKMQARTEERQRMVEKFQEQEQLLEREKFERKLTGQIESIEWFKNLLDDFEVERIKMRGDCIEGVDELDEIEIMRESIEVRCEKFFMSEFEMVKVIGELRTR